LKKTEKIIDEAFKINVFSSKNNKSVEDDEKLIENLKINRS